MDNAIRLLPCRDCGADCRIERFGPSEHIQGTVDLWVCSNHKRFGGTCPSDLAYFSAEAWNGQALDRLSPDLESPGGVK